MKKPLLLVAVVLCAAMVFDSPTASAKTRHELEQKILKNVTVQKRLRASRRVTATAVRLQRVRAANPIVASAIGKPKTISTKPDIAVTRPAVKTPSLPPIPKPAPAPNRTRMISAPGQPVQSDSTQLEILRLVNKERAAAGVQQLRIHSALQESAQLYANDMNARDFFGHRDPDGNSSLDRIRAAGFLTSPCECTWTYATGENLARGQTTPAEVVQAWMNSPSHRQNMVHAAYTDIGIGYRDGYWVQHFGALQIEVSE